MRILFTSAGGRGHSDPLLPIARAAQAVGHAVAFCCRPPMAEAIEAAGFRAFTAGPAITTPATIAPLLPLDTEREARVVRDGFAGRGIAHQRAAALPDVCGQWRPDVLVCDETDFGALVAAVRLDLPLRDGDRRRGGLVPTARSHDRAVERPARRARPRCRSGARDADPLPHLGAGPAQLP